MAIAALCAVSAFAACSATAADKAKASPDSAASLSANAGGSGAAGSAAKSTPSSTSQTGVRTAKPVLLFVGTSLTAGLGLEPDSAYPMLIQQKIDSAGLSFEVVNAGVSGETSSGLLDRLDWLTRAKFDVLVLETGANDGLRGVPTSTLKSNIETALDRLKATRPEAKVVLVQMEALPNLGPKYASDFHALYGAVAKEKGVALLPFLLTDVAGKRELNQADGVHPNNRGEKMVAGNVWGGLRPILEAAVRR